MNKRLEELKIEVDKLKHLLDDPQPGLASWCMLYGECMTNINNFWNQKQTTNQ